jgi:hypothetical protein
MSRLKQIDDGSISSVRQLAASCNVRRQSSGGGFTQVSMAVAVALVRVALRV